MKDWTRLGLLVIVALAAGCLQIIGYEDARSGWAGVCAVDGVRNGEETDVDCGGGVCPACGDSKGCRESADCASHICRQGVCAKPACDDGAKNGDETDVDCGGSCGACGPGAGCSSDADCVSGDCKNGACVSSCSDNAKGGSETDVDCGGPDCAPCADGLVCKSGPDCASGLCQAAVCSSNYDWAKDMGEARGPLAVDGLGNVLVAGGPAWVAALDATGTTLWSGTYINGSPWTRSITADASGGSWIAGSYSGTLSASTYDYGYVTLSSAGLSDDLFVARLDAAGHVRWVSGFGDDQLQLALGVAADSTGNVALTGLFMGTLNFGGGDLVASGVSSAFVAKLGGKGEYLWARAISAQPSAQGLSVTVDQADNVLLVATIQGQADFGGGVVGKVGTASVAVAKYDPDGKHVWSRSYSGSGAGTADIKLDAEQNIILAVTCSEQPDFGGGILSGGTSADVCVVKLDGSGNHIWSKRFGDAQDQWVKALAVDAAGNIAITGQLSGKMTIDGAPLTSAGGNDVFVAKLDPNGKHVWSRRFGDASDQYGTGVGLDSAGHVYVSGQFSGSIDFGGGPFVGPTSPDTRGFLARFRIP